VSFVSRRTVRFEDVDFAQVVFFPNLFVYCHNAFEDFFAAEVKTPYAQMLAQRGVAFPAVHTESDFKAPLRFGDEIRVELDVLKVGQTSLTCRYRLYSEHDGALLAELKVVTAAIALDGFSSVDLPPDVRSAFSAHLIKA
jgi:4-hydroxybenzoyl-CoA thioesterase